MSNSKKTRMSDVEEVVEVIASDPFSKVTVMKMIQEDRQQDVKQYIKKYFFKVLKPVCIFYYDTTDSSFYQISHEDFGKGYITPLMVYKVINADKVKTIKYSDWFKNEDTDDYILTFEVSKPRIYEANGLRYLNMFKGFKYAETNVDKITKSVQDKIQLIWNHIKEVICSNDQTAYEYMRKWISHFVNGRKMKTALYLKGTQGAGKSTLPKFLMNVIGERNVFFTQSNNCLTNRFNAELQGIVLLFLDELRCANTSEWKIMNSTLNVLTTEDYVSIEAKGKDAINIKNHISIIITSNDSPVQMNKNDRRYLMTDISNKRTGDVEYFNKLYSCLEDIEVQKAFYWDCKDFANKNPFNEQAELKNVETDAKSEVLIRNLHPVYQYLKSQYVLKRKDFNVYLKDFTESYNNHSGSKSSPIENSRLLKEIGIIGKNSTGNRHRYKLSSNELLEIFKKNKWMHEMDEFDEEDEFVPDNETKGDYVVESKSCGKSQETEILYQRNRQYDILQEQFREMEAKYMNKISELEEKLQQKEEHQECKSITTKSKQSFEFEIWRDQKLKEISETLKRIEEDRKKVEKMSFDFKKSDKKQKNKREFVDSPEIVKQLEAEFNSMFFSNE